MSFRGTSTPRKPDKPGKWQIPMRPHGGTGHMEYYLEGETRELFIKNFPKHSNRRMTEWFGVSFATLQRLAHGLGLRKDMKAIRRELARDVRKTCERNGHYASMRGRPPSEACIEAARKKRASGFSPIRQLKETDPRRYKRIVRKRSETRRELIRKERLRQFYGLDRKTKLHLPDCPMSHAASAQKHAMIRMNNYFACPEHPSWVCYDSETRRSRQREATAARHGLRVVEGE